jgi:CubicO group peptidase (beta-lactamase class C family)
MSAAVVASSGLEKMAVAGYRKLGDSTPASLDDLWHLGSDTKIMTAVLAATFVEEGKLRWDTTVSDIFPELASSFNPAFRTITLTQLLSHRAGLPHDVDYAALLKLDSVRDQRLGAVKAALSGQPRHVPGSEYEYSNIGYIIVGSMLERISGEDWESLMRTRVFEPLGMGSAGFGGLSTSERVDQPWGHQKLVWVMLARRPEIDNPPVFGPAGRVHCSIQDWGKFIEDQLRGARGEAGILKPESYHELQSAHFPQSPTEQGQYGFGWGIYDRSWAGGVALHHTGSNTLYYAEVWIAPGKDFAVLACANAGLEAGAATDAAIERIIQAIEAHGEDAAAVRKSER